MDRNDIIGLFGFVCFAIGTYLISPSTMFILCGTLCMTLAIFGARKGVNNK